MEFIVLLRRTQPEHQQQQPQRHNQGLAFRAVCRRPITDIITIVSNCVPVDIHTALQYVLTPGCIRLTSIP